MKHVIFFATTAQLSQTFNNEYYLDSIIQSEFLFVCATRTRSNLLSCTAAS